MSILDIKNLSAGYDDLLVVKDVSFSMSEASIVGIAGESGCGKSTLLKSIMNLPGNNITKTGSMMFCDRDIMTLNQKQMREILGKDLCVIFQKPENSMDPICKISTQFYEAVRIHDKRADKKEVLNRSADILEKLHFDNPTRVLNSYPFEMSGGMNQRIAIALSLINQPKLILADEPTSALDVSVQSEVIRLIREVREEFGTAVLIVSHNMNVLAQLSDKIGIMYGGRMVEFGTNEDVLGKSRHPYTMALMNSVPKMSKELPSSIPGMPPRFGEIIEGCPFRERCSYADENCIKDPMVCGTDDHWWLCDKR